MEGLLIDVYDRIYNLILVRICHEFNPSRAKKKLLNLPVDIPSPVFFRRCIKAIIPHTSICENVVLPEFQEDYENVDMITLMPKVILNASFLKHCLSRSDEGSYERVALKKLNDCISISMDWLYATNRYGECMDCEVICNDSGLPYCIRILIFDYSGLDEMLWCIFQFYYWFSKGFNEAKYYLKTKGGRCYV